MTNSSQNVDTLTALATVLEARKSADPAKSYVARLHRDGPDSMLQKVGEEAVESSRCLVPYAGIFKPSRFRPR